MVDRCNAVGVQVYVEVVINHMVDKDAGQGYGTNGSFYDAQVCSGVLRYAQVWPGMFRCAKICSGMFRCGRVCPGTSPLLLAIAKRQI